MSILARAAKAWKNRNALRASSQYLMMSSSSFGEDLIFERLLQPGSKGTYVDVGANDPISGSNTFRLYLKGWRGLAIDPNPAFASAFARLRPQDEHLVMGVASEPTALTYYEFENDVLNTFSVDRVDQLSSEGTRPIGKREVPCRPLSDIVADRLQGRQIDLLSVDCEGLDRDVIASLDLSMNRPTAMIVEDFGLFHSFTASSSRGDFERFLRESGYKPLAQTAWSGLFVAEDWSDLMSKSKAFSASKLRGGYLPGQMLE